MFLLLTELQPLILNIFPEYSRKPKLVLRWKTSVIDNWFSRACYMLQVRYAPQLPFVLKGLTCTLLGGKKTGIVGRTGGGKSTLIQALFRIVDPCIGQVFIDGTDICTIGLHDLRTRLSIIPQDPVMFEGTLRTNIDPLGEYSDEKIWEVHSNR
jgi:ABC-type multidrug transport system fused ATPase/permease subunit